MPRAVLVSAVALAAGVSLAAAAAAVWTRVAPRTTDAASEKAGSANAAPAAETLPAATAATASEAQLLLERQSSLLNAATQLEARLDQLARSLLPAPTAVSNIWATPCLAPLRAFFERRGLALPSLTALAGEQVAHPACDLLVHKRPMTPTLSSFWRDQPVALRVRDKQEQREEGMLNRWIVLEVSKNERIASPSPASPSSATASPSPSSSRTFATPVEFGSIFIHVHNLPSSLHSALWAGAVPFATLLTQHSPPIEQTCHPQLFFRMEWTAALREALGISEDAVQEQGADSPPIAVYGRCNTMRDLQGRVICEVVEVIPPMR